jgi:hypothetical protein
LPAELDGADARALADDRLDDDAAGIAWLDFDADVIEESGLPEVREVALDGVGDVRVAGNDAEVDADRVACDGAVADGFEPLDDLARHGLLRRLRCVGDASLRRRVENHARTRLGLLLRGRGLSPCDSAGDRQDHEHDENSSHKFCRDTVLK